MKKILIILLFVNNLALSQVGIGTTTPDASSILELGENNKGFLPNRVLLVNSTDAVTISNPATGLTIYHSGNSILPAGLYTNIGTSILPKWERSGENVFSDTQGSRIYKIKFLGRNTDPDGIDSKGTVKVPELNLEYRFAVIGTDTRFQIRLIDAPAANVNIKSSGHWHGQSHGNSNSTISFTTADYNTWKNIDETNWNGWWSFLYYMSTDQVGFNNYIGIVSGLDSYGVYGTGSTNIAKEFYLISVEVY